MPRACFDGGSESIAVRNPPGNVAPSPNPSITLARNNVVRLPAKPVRIVAAAQMTPQTKSAQRGPNRSPTHPPW